jgi:hypothetical protein
MELDKIVILVMAIVFFGGLGYIAWKGKQEQRKGGQASSSATPDRIGWDSSNKSQEKERRTSKS